MLTLSTVFTALVALVGAFGGAYLNNRFSEKRWVKQIEHENEKERKNFLRNKGEEAFKLLKKWEKELFIFNSSRIAFLQGTIQKHEMNSNIEGKINNATHGELDVLIALYFSNFSDELDAIHIQVASVNEVFRRGEDKVLNNLEVSTKMILECAVYERLLGLMSKKLKTEIKSI